MDQGGGETVWHEVPLGQTERQQRENQPGCSTQVCLPISGGEGQKGGPKQIHVMLEKVHNFETAFGLLANHAALYSFPTSGF